MTYIASRTSERLFPGLVLTHFSISRDGKRVVFATEQGVPGSGIWVGWVDGTQAPRQLTSGGEYRAFFGKTGEIVYQGNRVTPKVMKMREDGSGQGVASDVDIILLQNVSPDGKWAVVGTTPSGGHGERNALVVAVPLEGGEPVTVCDTCSFGFGVTRFSVPLLSWSPDGRAMYVTLRAFPFGSAKTAVILVKAGAALLSFTKGFAAEADFTKMPGAQLLNEMCRPECHLRIL